MTVEKCRKILQSHESAYSIEGGLSHVDIVNACRQWMADPSQDWEEVLLGWGVQYAEICTVHRASLPRIPEPIRNRENAGRFWTF